MIASLIATQNVTQGGNALMLTDQWAKSSFSWRTNCVEARQRGTVDVRDSKEPGPVLSFSPAAWRGFLDTIKSGNS
jgi:Domain of unknown function (DUF397)